MAFSRRSGRGDRVRTWYSETMTDQLANRTMGDANTTGMLIADYDGVRLRTDAAPTLIRIRGSITVRFVTSEFTNASGCSLAMGLILIPEYASPPRNDPVTNQNEDWIWYGVATVANHSYSDRAIASGTSAGSPTAGGVMSGPASVARLEVDSKAMRKIKPGEDLVLCVKEYANTGVDTVGIIGGLRCLWLG